HAGRGRGVVVHAFGGKRCDLEEGRARVEQGGDAFARRQLAAGDVFLQRLLATAVSGTREAAVELGDQRAMVGDGVLELLRARIQAGIEYGHAVAGELWEAAKHTGSGDRPAGAGLSDLARRSVADVVRGVVGGFGRVVQGVCGRFA